MSKSETQRCRSSNNFTSLIILRAVAWAHILVSSSVPWNNATQMCAYSVDCVVSKFPIFNNKVMSISFQTLNQLSSTFSLWFNPSALLNSITVSIQSCDTSGASPWSWRDEEVNEPASHPKDWHTSSAQKDKVHNRSSLHIWYKFVTAESGPVHSNIRSSWDAPRFGNSRHLRRVYCLLLIGMSRRHKHLNVIVFHDLLLGVEVVDSGWHTWKASDHLRLLSSLGIDKRRLCCFHEAHLILGSGCSQLSFGRSESGTKLRGNHLCTFSSLMDYCHLGGLLWLFTEGWNSGIRNGSFFTDWRSYSISKERLLGLIDLLKHTFSISKIII